MWAAYRDAKRRRAAGRLVGGATPRPLVDSRSPDDYRGPSPIPSGGFMSRAIAPEPEPTAETASCVVNSWNEWDPLEEVVVGRLEGAAAPPSHVTMVGNLPAKAARLYPLLAGRRYPR